MGDYDLVLSGTIVQARKITENGYVAVRDGTIEHIGQGTPPAAKERHDFGKAYVLPGAIDSQVHSRSQKGQEDFIWSTRAAAAGGVTTIVDMTYDDGMLICTADRLRAKAEEAGAQARVDFALYGTVRPDEGAKHIAAMVAAGAAGFKFSTFGTHPERFPRVPPHVLATCFAEIAKHGLIAGVHNENDEFVRACLQMGGETNWIALARKYVAFQGLPARIAWLGHGERADLALAVNRMVREGIVSGPIAFTRDHLDAGAMAHPNIMTENMRDGSDAIADWPLLNAMINCASQADLVAIHSGGGGYSGYMTSAGVAIIADGTSEADERLRLSLTNDTALGVMRYADAGYEEAFDEIEKKQIRHFDLRD